jgi:hypothetical protein
LTFISNDAIIIIHATILRVIYNKTGDTKMLQLQTNGVFGIPATSNYASMVNARFNNTKSSIKTIKQRWDETYNALPKDRQRAIDYALSAAKAEFHRRNPTLKTWADVSAQLAKAYTVKMAQVSIDGTMQRQLDIDWVIYLLNCFMATKVIPIHVYQPDPGVEKYLAWDGQHTLVLLWLIATQIMEVDPKDINIPINVYASHLKPEMRENLIDLNSKVGKKMFEQIDEFEQMVFGVRVDGSQNPIWMTAEEKQTILEDHGLFVTAKKFGNTTEAGAISRMQEVNKLTTEALTWLCDYLVAVGAQNRPVEEKEIVMMAYFFERCRIAKIDVTEKYALDVAKVAKQLWDADFTPTSKYWVRVGNAYTNWHTKHVGVGIPRLSKEPNHGYPFLVEQLKKALPNYKFPDNRSSSEFVPDAKDLF